MADLSPAGLHVTALDAAAPVVVAEQVTTVVVQEVHAQVVEVASVGSQGPSVTALDAAAPVVATEQVATVVVQEVRAQVVEVVAVGPQGPAGQTGPTGQTGATGAAGDISLVHEQPSASAAWAIAHNLGKYPSATVVDGAGDTVEGDVTYTSVNSLLITFSAAFSGRAFLN